MPGCESLSGKPDMESKCYNQRFWRLDVASMPGSYRGSIVGMMLVILRLSTLLCFYASLRIVEASNRTGAYESCRQSLQSFQT